VKIAGRIACLIMAVMNVLFLNTRNTLFIWIILTIGIIVVILDIYLEPTRRKVLFYSISAVLLALLWIALDREWITALMFI
jgi:hypothetical protein